MTPYHKNEWYDCDSKITVGDVIELPNMSFGLVSKVMTEETEDTYGNLIAIHDEYVVTCLYTGKSSTVSEREHPTKIHKEYLNEVLTTAPTTVGFMKITKSFIRKILIGWIGFVLMLHNLKKPLRVTLNLLIDCWLVNVQPGNGNILCRNGRTIFGVVLKKTKQANR